MRIFIILGIFMVNIHSLPAQKLVPADFSFRTLIADSTDSLTSSNNMRSNIVTEIILATDSTVWLGTGLGVSVIRDSLTVENIPDSAGLANTAPGYYSVPEPLFTQSIKTIQLIFEELEKSN